MEIDEQKKRLRKETLAVRDAMPAAERARKSRKICERVIRCLQADRPVGPDAPVLLVYLPFGSEVDVMPVVEWGLGRGIPLAAPRMAPGKRMTLHLFADVRELSPNRLGIREPDRGCPQVGDPSRIGWILVPGVAFDRERRRLGYGGGYYDRLFAELQQMPRPRPPAIAPAFAAQLVRKVPAAPHDFRVDRIITEDGVI